MTARREVRFATLDDAVRDAEALLASGYEKAGNWDLAQVCDHLSDWMGYQMDGFPNIPAPVRLALWVMRNTVGPAQVRKVLAGGPLPEKSPTLTQTVHPPGGDPVAAVERFRATAERIARFGGELLPSSLFGRLPREDFLTLHRRHAEHHLSFLKPQA